MAKKALAARQNEALENKEDVAAGKGLGRYAGRKKPEPIAKGFIIPNAITLAEATAAIADIACIATSAVQCGMIEKPGDALASREGAGTQLQECMGGLSDGEAQPNDSVASVAPSAPEPSTQDAKLLCREALQALVLCSAPATAEAAVATTKLADDALSNGAVARPTEVAPHCRKCNAEVNVLDPKVRIFQKGSMVAQCQACGRRQVGLIRVFETSYIPDFEGISEEASFKFWDTMPSGLSSKAMESYIVNTPTEKNYHRLIDEVVGKFLPLSWYKTNGFDIIAIEAHTADSDKEEHEVLGMTYRVNIHETKETQVWERVRVETHKYVENLKQMQRKANVILEVGGRGEKTSRSRSRSQSQPRQGKGPASENARRDKMEKQLQEKLEKERQKLKEREEAAATRKEEQEREKERKKDLALKEKDNRVVRNQASRNIQFLTPTRIQLDEIMTSKGFRGLPKLCKTELTKHAAKMGDMMTEAETKQKAKEPEPLTYDADALKGFMKEVKACISTLPE